jgi:hypothetical protein
MTTTTLTLPADDLDAFRRMLGEQIAGAADWISLGEDAAPARDDLRMAWALADQLPGGLGLDADALLPRLAV